MIYLFWFSLSILLYAYLGYPGLLAVAARLKKGAGRTLPGGKEPYLSLLISAHNEEKGIEAKIQNSLELDYPPERVEIIVLSDGSTDATDGIVAGYAGRGVRLVRLPRRGKSAGLNGGVKLARGEILVFSDANSLYERRALRELVRPLGDGSVGLVSGRTRYVSSEDGRAVRPIGLYARLEGYTKKKESAIGSCVGADGAIFALRRELYQHLDDRDLNDLALPLRVVKRGQRCVLAEEAFCLEEAAPDLGRELSRQVRIASRTLRTIGQHAMLLNPARYGFFALQLLSHKLLRLLSPFFLLLLGLANLSLLSGSWFYLLTFSGQVLTYLLAAGCWIWPAGRRFWGVSLPLHFVMVNLAALGGWIKYLRGQSVVLWDPSR